MKKKSQLCSLIIFLSAFTVPLLLNGCGTSGPQPVPVAGVITFNGQACPSAGFIYFTVVKNPADSPNQPGSAPFAADGRFEVVTSQGKGLFPGTYRVRIDCWKEPPTELSPGVSHVPPSFTPPNLEIPENSTAPIHLRLDVPTNSESGPSSGP